jgi:hypothetical protein
MSTPLTNQVCIFQWTNIFMDIDLKEGMEETIDIDFGDTVYTLILDYLNIPFWCM